MEMEVKGRMLTEEERAEVRAPYNKNSGQNWTLEKIRNAVCDGDKAIRADATKNEEINIALDSLYKG
jgi:hypothetical protein